VTDNLGILIDAEMRYIDQLLNGINERINEINKQLKIVKDSLETEIALEKMADSLKGEKNATNQEER